MSNGIIHATAIDQAAANPGNKRYVLHLVWDGISTNLFQKIKSQGIKTPNIDGLINNGLYLDNIKTTVPSCGAALAATITGASPETNDCMYRYYDKENNNVGPDKINVKAKTIFERINLQKADMKTLVLGFNVYGVSINGRGISATDPIHTLKEYSKTDSLINFTNEAEDIKTALNNTPDQIPQYILAYSNDMKYAAGIEHLSTVVSAMDKKLGEIMQLLKDKGIYDNTTIIINSASSTYASRYSIGANMLQSGGMAYDITANTGVKTAYLSSGGLDSATKAVFIKTYMMRYGQLSFSKNATQEEKDKVINYLKDNYLLTDPINASGKLIKQIVLPSDVGASPNYADYLFNPIDNNTFSYNSRVYRPDDLDQMNQLFIISGYGINKSAAVSNGTVMDIPSNISYLLNITTPENNEGKLWDIFNFQNNTPINISIDNYQDGQLVNDSIFTLRGHVDNKCTVTVNGEAAVLNSDNTFSKDIQLREGNNLIKIEADSNGEKYQRYINILKEVKLVITSPSDKQIVKQDTVNVEGTVDKPCNITINGESLGLIQDKFSKVVQLSLGLNTIVVSAELDGHTVTRSIKVDYISPDDVYTVYINWDGFGKYFYDLASAQGKTPVLDSLAKEGVMFNNCYSGIPSITPVMQRCIVSGAWPVTTGYCYRYYDKTAKTVVESSDVNNAETMAEAVSRNGMKTASVHQFTLLNKGTTPGDKNHPYITVDGDGTVRFTAAAELIKGEKAGSGSNSAQMDEIPRFMAIYMDDPDAIAHNDRDIVAYLNKPAATTEEERINNTIEQLHKLDQKLGEFIQVCKDRGIYDNMAFVLTTDHGMANFGQQENGETDPPSMLEDLHKTLTDLGYKSEHLYTGSKPQADTAIVGVGTGGQEQLSFTRDYTEQDIQKITKALTQKDYVGEILTKDELVKRGCSDGFADLIVSPKPPYHFKQGDTYHIARGFHDSLDDKAQHVFALMWGKGIRKGYEYNDRVNLIDFMPTLSTLMKIDGPKNATGEVLYNALDTIYISNTPSSIKMTLGTSIKLIPDSTLTSEDTVLSWQSSNPLVADIDSNGIITAKDTGDATINLFAGNDIVGTCYVKVEKQAVHVKEVSLNRESADLTVGDTLKLKAKVNPENAVNKKITWISDNPTVAGVDSKGNVTAKNAGFTNIIVTSIDGTRTAVCRVSVKTMALPHQTMTQLQLKKLREVD
jgi:Uncharacterized proteins of the AP superfamily